jgi:PPOX class probable F420-dependent enzyme
MELHPDLAAAIDAGVHGHLITIGRDGRPQVSVIWLGRDGDELLVAHLRDGQKLRNIERDDRVAISVEVPGTTDNGLQPWAVFHGTARITAGGGPELLQDLAARFLGPGVKFPPMDDPPPGHIIHVVVVDRVTGAGPWA